ncbi:hypothetical protein [Clostridium sp.]
MENCDDSLWWNYTLKKDPFFKRLLAEEKSKIIEDSIKCAVEMYKKLIHDYGNLSALEYANKLGVKVIEEDLKMDSTFMYIAFYNSKPPTIRLSNTTIDMISELIEKEELKFLLNKQELKEIALVHELFHHLEHLNKNIYTRGKNTEVRLFNIVNYKVCTVSASEIAAIYFSKLMKALQYSPCIYEILLISTKNKEHAEKIINEILA